MITTWSRTRKLQTAHMLVSRNVRGAHTTIAYSERLGLPAMIKA